MPYRLLVTDLDGTLLEPDHTLAPQVAAACRRLQDAGCMVTFATGRMWGATTALAETVGVQVPVIVYQGALARRVGDAEPVWHDPVPLEAASEILQWLHRQGAHASICHGDELILSHPEPRTLAFYESVGVRPRVAAQLHRELAQPPSRIAVFGHAHEMQAWEARLQEAFPDGLRIARSMSHLVEITHPRASKGQAIRRLAAMLGVEMAEVVACGDNYNDLDMLAEAGLGVAMAEAPDDVRALAGRVVDRSTGGLAGFFEELAADLDRHRG